MPAVLNYFGFPARGEATRVALAVGGNAFEDKRLTREEFEASSFKSLPVFQVYSNFTRILLIPRMLPQHTYIYIYVRETVLFTFSSHSKLTPTLSAQYRITKLVPDGELYIFIYGAVCGAIIQVTAE